MIVRLRAAILRLLLAHYQVALELTTDPEEARQLATFKHACAISLDRMPE